ncbi:MAG: hypothetical protein H7A33_01000 [Deltaproteobacteria bacterium]|nr:hypothetical protein [Deltaproteobacteria bacterium]
MHFLKVATATGKISCFALLLLLSLFASQSAWSAPEFAYSSHEQPLSKRQFTQSRGRNHFAINLDALGHYGFTDKHDLLFQIPTTNIRFLTGGARAGLEGINNHGFGFRVLGGYRRVLWVDQGKSQVEKNIYSADVFLDFHPIKEVKTIDPYVFAGPTILISSHAPQGHLSFGAGIKIFLSDVFALRIEPSGFTAFEGIQGQISLGLAAHFD